MLWRQMFVCYYKGLPMSLDLRQRDAAASLPLREITGQSTTTPTTCSFRRDEAGVVLTVRCDDPNMRDLIATVPNRVADGFVFEEDCLQLAIAQPGDADIRGLLVVNAMNKRTAIADGQQWRSTVDRDADGWTATIHVPVDVAQPGVGVSLHRYFRGLRHEIHGLTPTLPHPLDTATFVVLATHAHSQVPAVVEDYEITTRKGKEAALDGELARHRARLAAAKRSDSRKASLDTTRHFAKLRMQQPVSAKASGLCWNEGHFLNALADLFSLDGDVNWIAHACDRADAIWQLRADRQGRVDPTFGYVRPTWYDATEPALCLITGAIMAPIVRVMRMVLEDNALRSLRARVAPWLAWCGESIAAHEDEWLALRDGQGMYLEPYEKGPRRVYPTGGSRVCPLNRAYFLAMPMLHVARLTNDDAMLAKVHAMARYFEAISETLDDGSMVWEYEEGRYAAVGEDTSHAACQVQFAELCESEGVVFDESHLRAMARTLRLQILKHGDVACGTVRGLDPCLDIATAAWSTLCRFEPSTFPAIEAIVNVMLHEGKFDCAQQGWGVRVMTILERGRRMV